MGWWALGLAAWASTWELRPVLHPEAPDERLALARGLLTEPDRHVEALVGLVQLLDDAALRCEAARQLAPLMPEVPARPGIVARLRRAEGCGVTLRPSGPDRRLEGDPDPHHSTPESMITAWRSRLLMAENEGAWEWSRGMLGWAWNRRGVAEKDRIVEYNEVTWGEVARAHEALRLDILLRPERPDGLRGLAGLELRNLLCLNSPGCYGMDSARADRATAHVLAAWRQDETVEDALRGLVGYLPEVEDTRGALVSRARQLGWNEDRIVRTLLAAPSEYLDGLCDLLTELATLRVDLQSQWAGRRWAALPKPPSPPAGVELQTLSTNGHWGVLLWFGIPQSPQQPHHGDLARCLEEQERTKRTELDRWYRQHDDVSRLKGWLGNHRLYESADAAAMLLDLQGMPDDLPLVPLLRLAVSTHLGQVQVDEIDAAWASAGPFVAEARQILLIAALQTLEHHGNARHLLSTALAGLDEAACAEAWKQVDGRFLRWEREERHAADLLVEGFPAACGPQHGERLASVRLERGWRDFDAGLRQSAWHHFQAARRGHPLDALLGLANLYTQTGQFEQALEALSARLSIPADPGEPLSVDHRAEARLQLARLLMELGRIDLAWSVVPPGAYGTGSLQEVVALAQAVGAARRAHGRAAALAGEGFPDQPGYTGWRIGAAIDRGDDPLAWQLVREDLERWGETPLPWGDVVDLARRVGALQDLPDLFQAASHPLPPLVAWAAQLHDLEQHQTDGLELLARAPGACGTAGGEDTRRGEPGAAVPFDPAASVLLGDALVRAGRPRAAERCYQRALVARPNLVTAWLGLARAQEAAGDAPAAEAMLWARITATEHHRYRLALADLLRGQGRREEADRVQDAIRDVLLVDDGAQEPLPPL